MDMLNNVSFSHLVTMGRPAASATLRGNDRFPDITGAVRFYAADKGTLVVAEVFSLPWSSPRDGAERRYGPFYGFHLHEGASCGSPAGDDAFAAAGGHYNPTGEPHPYHAGDFPALLGNSGYAYMSFYTDRITPLDAVGKTVVVHQRNDDFHTQPSGDSGAKLACGVVFADITPLR